MPSIIIGGVFNGNAPTHNAAHCVGQYNIGGWDANQKQSQGSGYTYGSFNLVAGQRSVTLDQLEALDGTIADQDVKIQFSFNA